MAKHLTDSEIKRVVGLLTSWKGQLSWDLLSKACQDAIFRQPSRQTLSKCGRIALAFRATKDRLKDEPNGQPPSSIDMRVAQERIARLTNENAQLELENRLLLEQFVRWQYNANKAGLSNDRLNDALPRVDLRST